MRVLVTRPETDAAPFMALLEQHGMTPVLSPVMTIRVAETPLPDMSAVRFLAFTSANGIRSFASKTSSRVWPVFAVGPATATAAKAEGFDVAGIAESSVESLARIITTATGKTDLIAHIAGTHRAGDLRTLLEAGDRQCLRIVCYEARQQESLSPEVHEQLTTGDISAATFFSPRSAKIFLELIAGQKLNTALRSLNCFCLSPAVAEAIKAAETGEIVIAPEPNLQAMIDILISART